ncbi:MAG: amino acid synthesis family protein [Vicinamibacteria bacterium]
MEVRQIHLFVQEIAEQAGRPVRPPALRAACCAVLANPRAGQPAMDDFESYVAASVEVGEVLTRRALDGLGGRVPVAYGKAALVGEAGDLEQGAAMIHCRIGLAMRTAIRAGNALIPGNARMGGPGEALDIVLGGIDDGWHYDAMDTMTVGVPGAPRADEILLAVAFATGRPNARIAGASEATVRELVARLRG